MLSRASHVRVQPTFRPRPRLSQPKTRRSYSAFPLHTPRCEDVRIQCRSNGFITLNIFHPKASRETSPIVIYLPSGPIITDQADYEETNVTHLSNSTEATIVRVNYRLGPEYQYPLPIHDVLTGYDWVMDNLLPNAATSTIKSNRIKRLGVCGQLVGGSLATMLALTECRLGQHRIGAAAVNNPVVDWVFPQELPELPRPHAAADITDHDEDASLYNNELLSWWAEDDAREAPQESPVKKTRTKKPSSWETNSDNAALPTSTLLQARDHFFRKPEHYLDRFASPLCFFRSPSGQIVPPPDEDLLASKSSFETEVDYEAQLALEHYESRYSTPVSPSSTQDVPRLSRCRTYARVYPPSTAMLALPELHITTGVQSPLLDQATELAKVMKRSIARQDIRPRYSSDQARNQAEAQKAKSEELAESKIQLHIKEGIGLWGGEVGPNTPINSVGSWLREKLG